MNPSLAPEIRERLWPYLGGIARESGMKALAVGGVADHVHVLLSLPATHSVSKAVQLLKGNSSKWLHQTFPTLRNVAWQEGYGAFSIGISGIDETVAYIRAQRSIIAPGHSATRWSFFFGGMDWSSNRTSWSDSVVPAGLGAFCGTWIPALKRWAIFMRRLPDAAGRRETPRRERTLTEPLPKPCRGGEVRTGDLATSLTVGDFHNDGRSIAPGRARTPTTTAFSCAASKVICKGGRRGGRICRRMGARRFAAGRGDACTAARALWSCVERLL